MLLHASCCVLVLEWVLFLKPGKHSSFKTQLRCYHLQEVFPNYPCSLHSDPVQDPRQGSSESPLAFCAKLIPTLSASPQQCPRAHLCHCTRHITWWYFHLHLCLQLTEHIGDRTVLFISMSSFWHIVSTKVLVNWMFSELRLDVTVPWWHASAFLPLLQWKAFSLC